MAKVRCLLCNDVIESQYRHDFVTCSCGALSVDGGRDYTRIIYNKKEDWEFVEEEETNEHS